MVAWVVINRQQPRQSRKSRPIRGLPLLARLFNIPTFQRANCPASSRPCTLSNFGSPYTLIPEKVTPFFSCTYVEPILQPFCFQIHAWNGGCTSLCGNYKSWPQIMCGQPLFHNMLWWPRAKTEYPHRLVYPFLDVRSFRRFDVFPTYPLSFHILAHSFALFCTRQKLNLFI